MKHLLLILAFSAPLFTFGQSPWSVNTTDYEFSMNITGKVKQNSQFINEANSYLAAFVNSDCRGVAQATLLESGGYAYFLTIYSNLSKGEELTFKFSDASSEISALPQMVLFKADYIYGTPDNLFIWADPVEFETTDMLNVLVENQVGETKIDKTLKTINMETGSSDLGTLQLFFELPTGAEAYHENERLLSGAILDFLNPVQVNIFGVDGQESQWTIHVKESKTGILNLGNSKVKVYPTLIKQGGFYVETDENLIYKLYALNGTLIQMGDMSSGKNHISLHRVPEGSYILWLSNGAGQRSIKLFKAK